MQPCYRLAGNSRPSFLAEILNRVAMRFVPTMEDGGCSCLRSSCSSTPFFVDIDHNGRVSIDLGREGIRFGVHAYPEDFEETFSGFVYGEREFIPGLWYYDPDYRTNPEYSRRIDALRDAD